MTNVNFSIVSSSEPLIETIMKEHNAIPAKDVVCYWTVTIEIAELFEIVDKLNRQAFNCVIRPGYEQHGSIINCVDIHHIKNVNIEE